LAGSPVAPRYAYPYAAWLALAPATYAWDRPAGEAVVSHESACQVLGLGAPTLSSATLTAVRPLPEPRATVLHVAELRPDDITVHEGVPVTTARRTVVDLVRDHTDHLEVRRAITDAVRLDLVDLTELYDDLRPLAAEFHFPGAGPEFARYFLADVTTGALSVRNLRALAELVLPDRVDRAQIAVASALAAANVAADQRLSRDVAAEITGRLGLA
ncbi:MAG TPA: hypothetical protein VGJ44_07995, partial [Kribbellaceae bacterium]|jgi:hypothetical protein